MPFFEKWIYLDKCYLFKQEIRTTEIVCYGYKCIMVYPHLFHFIILSHQQNSFKYLWL